MHDFHFLYSSSFVCYRSFNIKNLGFTCTILEWQTSLPQKNNDVENSFHRKMIVFGSTFSDFANCEMAIHQFSCNWNVNKPNIWLSCFHQSVLFSFVFKFRLAIWENHKLNASFYVHLFTGISILLFGLKTKVKEKKNCKRKQNRQSAHCKRENKQRN